MIIKTATGSRTVASAYMRTATGLRMIELGTVVKGASAKAFFQSISVTASPSVVSGRAGAYGPTTVTTNATTATGVGGVGAITYTWTPADPDWAALSPNWMTTSFSKGSVSPGQTFTTIFTCTATDSVGARATTTVSATVKCVDIR